MRRRDFVRLSAAGGLAAVRPASLAACRGAETPHEKRDSEVLTGVQSEDGVVEHPFRSDVMRGSPPPADKVVTIDTYEHSHPHKVWALQHIRELCTTQSISRGSGPVAVLPRKTKDVGGLQIEDLSGKPLTVQKFLEDSFTDAFLVLHRGHIVTEQYFSGMGPETPHRIYSAGKPFAADLVAVLADEKKLDEEKPIVDYVRELGRGPYAGATVRHLLDMLSGVKYEYDLENVSKSMTEQGRHFRAAGICRKLPNENPNAGQYDFFLSLDKATRDHGTVFSYKCCDTGVLAWACERVTGCRFAELFSSRIWARLGVEHDASTICGPQGASTPNGGMSTTLRDLTRWGQMHLDKGMCRGRQIVPRQFLDDLQRHADPARITNDSSPPPDFLLPGWAYRSQFWLPEGRDGPYCAFGGYGQYCYVHPKYDTVITKFSSHKEFDVELNKLEMHAFRQIAERLSGF